jgi:triphosphoribosyl-dephospho-CoA synthase
MLGGAAPLNWAASKRWLNMRWPIGQAAALACCLEASAPKAGNVYPAASFIDMDFSDFLVCGLSVAPTFDLAAVRRVGQLVFDAVTVTRQRLDVNTNLGSLLLLAPLAKALASLSPSHELPTRTEQLHLAVQHVLDELDAQDAELIYG